MLKEHPAESVWDYPRPPRLEPTSDRIHVVHGAILIADTTKAFRVLETSHPPVYYIPQDDTAMQYIKQSPRRGSFCEFKGVATYWSIDITGASETPERIVVPDAAWSYAHPTSAFAPIRNHLAFYASKVDECTVDGERVEAQPGDFYGGWITSWIKGPFKGAPGTMGW